MSSWSEMSLRGGLNDSNKTGSADLIEDQDADIPPFVSYMMTGFIVIVVTLNIPSLTVLLFTKVKASNFVSTHILSLSLTDCGVGLSLLLTVSTRTFHYWECWTRFFVFHVMYVSSMSQVTVICLDRVAMFYNLKWRSITKNSSLLIKIILVTFLITIVIVIIPSLAFASPHDLSICKFENVFKDGQPGFQLYMGIIVTCLELLVLLCIAAIIGFLWKKRLSTRRLDQNPSHRMQNNSLDKEMQATVTLSIIAVVFIILTSPINFVLLLYSITGEPPTQNILMILTALACLNSAVNPIVYSFRIPDMKEAFNKLWHKIRCW